MTALSFVRRFMSSAITDYDDKRNLEQGLTDLRDVMIIVFISPCARGGIYASIKFEYLQVESYPFISKMKERVPPANKLVDHE